MVEKELNFIAALNGKKQFAYEVGDRKQFDAKVTSKDNPLSHKVGDIRGVDKNESDKKKTRVHIGLPDSTKSPFIK